MTDRDRLEVEEKAGPELDRTLRMTAPVYRLDDQQLLRIRSAIDQMSRLPPMPRRVDCPWTAADRLRHQVAALEAAGL